jgi:hypothetical protein
MNSDSRILAQEAKVSDLRKKEEELRRERELEEAVLRGMRLMVQQSGQEGSLVGLGSLLNPSVSPEVVKEFEARTARRGRQPGAISREWRDTLRELFLFGPFGIPEVVKAAHRHGLPHITERTAEERMRVHIAIGYVEAAGKDYAVTDSFAKKYGFDANKTEAPTADTEGAS